MKISRILIVVGICCIAGLLLVFGMHLQAQDRGRNTRVALNTNEGQQSAQRNEQFRNRQRGTNWGQEGRSNQSANWGNRERSENTPSNDEGDYYSVIVNNNIFRPLGWRPPNKEPEYTFISTSVYDNESESKGYVLERRSNQSYTVRIGDKIGDAVVTDIKDKEIFLDKDGERITLKPGNVWLQANGSSRRGGESRDNRNNDNNDDERNASSRSDREAEERERQAEQQRSRARGWEEARNRFRSASPQERERMMREWRERSGGYRGRRGGDR